MRILKDESLFLAIDFQERLIPAMNESEELVENTKKLFSGIKAHEIPMVFSQQYTKGLGMTIPELTEIVGEEFKYYDKVAFSCVEDETIYSEIKKYNKKTIIVAGIESHICVLQTVIDLIDEGYNVVVVSDCVRSRKDNDMKMALKRAEYEGAILSTYESVLFELTREAGSDLFKTISKIIK